MTTPELVRRIDHALVEYEVTSIVACWQDWDRNARSAIRRHHQRTTH